MAASQLIKQEIKRSGSTIVYWLTGPEKAALVVMTHGATIDHRTWNPQIKALAGKYRVMIWDVRGHGQSQPIGENFTIASAAEDLLAILDKLKVKQAVLIGQSMGGNIAQELVFNHPDRVQAMILLGCACNTWKQTWLEKIQMKLAVPILEKYPSGLWSSQMSSRSSIDPKVQAYLAEASAKVRKAGNFNHIWNALSLCLHYEPDYQIECPLLLAHGEHDNLGNFKKVMPKWAWRDPQARYVVIPNAGHVANQDNPKFFNQLLLDFLSLHVDGK
ncbi:MAG: alpha/beta hydrolase [Anaerolineaceae bacterium]|nr:alpha/beta hydrolase [Anaerolineaceae bacterium]MBN2676867.1 alpha/beta hydrolase [Anaerolineaceae bacterium]